MYFYIINIEIVVSANSVLICPFFLIINLILKLVRREPLSSLHAKKNHNNKNISQYITIYNNLIKQTLQEEDCQIQTRDAN